MKFFTSIKPVLLVALIPQLVAVSCTTIDLYEKSVTIPGHQWKSSFKPSFDFTIKDTSAPYRLFFILRHNEKYNFNNIFINVYVKGPGQDTVQKIQQNLVLATNDKGWLGTGMDDIYEHRIPLGPDQSLRAGNYTFTIEQIMREDPLENVLNAGLRIEKK
ncbi:gliding motility lipoprotein GldH [Terrimonas alba]|uniref:gliding motility lipoprotein GldH n=1 Tax=Terrimonas alba TaxID=3349636 RepID=UPI0035F44D26